MRYFVISSILLILTCSLRAQFQTSVHLVGYTSEPVSNNAVCGARVNDTNYVYSFCGIDSTKKYSGIHLKAFRYNTRSKKTIRLPDVPDFRGKIAAAASRVGNIIYVAGGYRVYQNGNEISSNKMHRFDITTNQWLTDGAPIPVATDDHVQAVWNDSLIYLITGWSNSSNIPNVQIYNPKLDSWQQGTPVPNDNKFKSFGAAGTILDNTIYYFGGASSGSGFPIQNTMRVGKINPLHPDSISWSSEDLDSSKALYRAAAYVFRSPHFGDTPYFIGGSSNTYNYNGIAYDGSGGVQPADKILYYLQTAHGTIETDSSDHPIPMDLRSIATFIGGTENFIMGGMEAHQKVSNKVLSFNVSPVSIQEYNKVNPIVIYPNPSNKVINFSVVINNPILYDLKGRLIRMVQGAQQRLVLDVEPGVYFVSYTYGNKKYSQRIVVTKQ